MTDADAVTLLIGGESFGGWKTLDLERSIEQLAGSFELSATLRWDGREEPYKLREGLSCQVKLGEDVVITGYVDAYEVTGDDSSTTVTISGRDRTADLIDCAAIHKSGQWRQATLRQIVADLARPFNIAVVVDGGADLGEAFKSFAIEEGERAFDAIDRACRMRAVLCTSTPAGDVLLTQASVEPSSVQLIEGVNIKSFSARHSWRERFSRVVIKGQGPGDDDEHGATVAHAKAEALDAEINRYRPLIVIAEHGAALQSLRDRAAWEVQVRMGRGKRGSVDVTGWRVANEGRSGQLWMPNMPVYIDSPRMNLAHEMLVVGCRYRLSERGRMTSLAFARPEAFDQVEGVRRSRLGGKLNHRTQREKKKKGDGYTPSWDLGAPVKGGQ